MVAALTSMNARQGGVPTPNRPSSATTAGGPRDEFDLIQRIRSRLEATGGTAPSGQVWIGDDAAVVESPGGTSMLLATDLVVGGVHVDLDRCTPGDIGYKSLMVTVSDLAAMGARPDHALLSVAAPAGFDIEGLMIGVAEAASETDCAVVGGDLSSSPVLVVSVAVTGSLRGSAPAGPLLRSGAAPGETVLLTGPLGASAAGLRLLGRDQSATPVPAKSAAESAAISSYRRPRARVVEGETARWAGATAAIDISDGMVADIRHLARASGVGVDLQDVPAAPAAHPDEALSGGEEYELALVTPDPERLERAFDAAGLRPPIRIGVCSANPGQLTLAGRAMPEGGWRHRF